MKDLRFKNFNTIFKAVSKDLKRQGLGSVDHCPLVEVVAQILHNVNVQSIFNMST
jgi:hypothetical protein